MAAGSSRTDPGVVEARDRWGCTLRKAGLAVLVTMAAATGVALLVLVADVPLSTVVSLGAGALCLLWLLLLLGPWNLYVQARRRLGELPVSRERGLAIPAGREEEARRIAARLLRLALGGHALSAAAAAVTGYFSGQTLGYWFSGFYLVSTV